MARDYVEHEERTIYLALELDRRWTEMTEVNPLDGTKLFGHNSRFRDKNGCISFIASDSTVETLQLLELVHRHAEFLNFHCSGVG